MKIIDISLIERNTGQIEGLPSNTRQISKEKMDKLVNNIKQYPEMLSLRGLLVYPHNDKYVTIGGNMRYTALQQLGIKDVPCIVIPSDTPVDKLKAYTILDNNEFGQWDWDMLANEWDEKELMDWGLDLNFTLLDVEEEKVANTNECEKGADEIEAMLNEATRCACKEIIEQYDILQGFSFITQSTAKMNFIKFKYQNKEYYRYNSLAFHPQQFVTAGDSFGSTYDGLSKVYKNEIKAERLRFVTSDKLSTLTKGSLAFSGCKMPLDFPAELARNLCHEFMPQNGGKMLDPCSGWGGRLVGFMAANIDNAEYHGVDASPLQVEGDLKIYNTYKDVCEADKKVKITVSPFEDYACDSEIYDFALTSPPYFDTEKYIGGKQSHENYNNYNNWRDGFYTALITKVYYALKKGGVFCLQVGSQRYPLLEDGKAIASECGFVVEEVRLTDMTNEFNKTDEEHQELIIILRK